VDTSAARRGYLYVTLAAALFAVNGSVSKVVLEAGIDPARLAALRCTGAALGLGALLLAVAPHRLRVTRREVPALILLGVAGAALVQWLYFIAIARIPIGIALLLEFTAPVFVALYVRLVRRHPVRGRTWLAIGVALAGLAMVAQVWTDIGLDPVGVVAGLGAAVCVATYFLVGGHTAATRDTGSLTFYMFFIGGVFWAIVLPWWTFDFSLLTAPTSLLGTLDAFTAPVWVGIVWVVAMGTLAPYSLNLSALRHISPTAVGVVGMSEPLGAGLVAWLWLGQTLTPVQVAGGVVVLVGIAIIQRSSAPPLAVVETSVAARTTAVR
jgi:drug/metabolite transporter (DMT)-like permease